MGYIVYTPDVERGPTAYTQRQFDTIGNVVKWGLDVLMMADRSLAEQKEYIVYVPNIDHGPEVYTQQKFDTIKDIIKWAMDIVIGDKPLAPAPQAPAPQAPVPQAPAPPAPVPPAPEPELYIEEVVDPIVTALLEGIPEDSPYRKLIEAKDWFGIAMEFDNMIHQRFFGEFKTYNKHTEYISCDINAVISSFLVQARKFASYIVSTFDDAPPIKWDLLPDAFKNAMSFTEKSKRYELLQLTATSPPSKDYATIWKFFSDGKRHKSWKGTTIEFNGIKWGDVKGLTEAVTAEWWSGKMPSDEIHEFIIKCVVVNILEKSDGKISKPNIVGANELLTEILSGLDRLELPASFIRWAGNGISHKHCKAALAAMDITQSRRSDGQKYVGITLVPNKAEGVYMFEHSLEPYVDSNSAITYELLSGQSNIESAQNIPFNIYDRISEYLRVDVYSPA